MGRSTVVEAVLPGVEGDRLRPFVPRLAVDWLRDAPGERVRAYPGTLVFADVSGFTALTEKLSRRGKEGAEEIAGVLDAAFAELVGAAYTYNADLLKWGGDAILLLFRGDEHPLRAVAAARGMQRSLERMRRYRTSAGPVRLQISIGAHSGEFQLFLVGSVHRELAIAGADATITVATEAVADADEVALSPRTAALLPPELRGTEKAGTVLLGRDPEVEPVPPPPFHTGAVDLAQLLPAEYTAELRGDPEEPEHRHVAVAFVEVCDTDDLLAREGAESLAAALDERISGIQEACLEHSVTFAQTDISKNAVKAILLTGAPRSAGGDEEELLLRAVREIADTPSTLPVRIGVNAGRIFAGIVGPPTRRTYTFYGDTINTAARIMVRAEPGQLLVADDVLERARTQYGCERVEPFEAKGKAEPVRASALGQAVGTRMPEAFGPLVGRSLELDTLIGLLDRARGGSSASVVLTGDPGVGKTRLVAELGAQAFGIRWFRIQCEQADVSHAYRIAGAILRAALGLTPSDTIAAVEQRLRDAVTEHAPELTAWLPLLAIVLELELPATPETSRLEAQFVPERIAESVATFLPRVVGRPALVTVDDAQWLDEASRTLLERIAALTPDAPWLWISTRREPVTGADCERESAPLLLHLLSLPAPFARDLVDALTEDAPLQQHVVDELVDRSGGNPLFLKQLVDVTRVRGGTEQLPESVEALLAAQIDELPARDRAALRQASVLGARFEFRTLLAALDLDDRTGTELLERLDEFLALEQGIVTFKHSLLRETAYEGLSYRRRRELHRVVAEAVMTGAEDLDDVAGTLSYHFQAASDWPRAWEYGSRAGLRAQERFALTDALVLLDRALAVSRRVRGLAGEDVARIAEALGDVCLTLGELDRARQAYRAARRRLRGDVVREAPLVFKLVRAEFRSGRYRQALGWITRGLRGLEGISTREARAERARFYSAYAAVSQTLGRPKKTIDWCERAIAEAESSGARDALAHGLYLLDWAYVTLGDQRAAVHSQRALELFEELGEYRWQAVVLNNLGIRSYYAGEWDDAARAWDEAGRRFDDVGDRWSSATTRANAAEILADQGRYDEAEPTLRDALRVWRAAGTEPRVAYGLRELGRIAARRGDAGKAAELLHEARGSYERLGDVVEVVATDARIAEAKLYAGETAEARAEAEAAIRRVESLPGATLVLPLLARVSGSALLCIGDDGAREQLTNALTQAEEVGAAAEKPLILDALVLLDETTGSVESWRTQRDELFERLGIVTTPELPVAG